MSIKNTLKHLFLSVTLFIVLQNFMSAQIGHKQASETSWHQIIIQQTFLCPLLISAMCCMLVFIPLWQDAKFASVFPMPSCRLRRQPMAKPWSSARTSSVKWKLWSITIWQLMIEIGHSQSICVLQSWFAISCFEHLIPTFAKSCCVWHLIL
jgi:hypothetical protein